MNCFGNSFKTLAIVLLLSGCGDDPATEDMDAGGGSGASQGDGGSMTGGSGAGTGGMSATGGVSGTGGMGATGGANNSGGTGATGGASNSGGAGNSGGTGASGSTGGMAGMDATGGAGGGSDAGTECVWENGTGLDNGKQNLNMCTACSDDTSCDAPV